MNASNAGEMLYVVAKESTTWNDRRSAVRYTAIVLVVFYRDLCCSNNISTIIVIPCVYAISPPTYDLQNPKTIRSYNHYHHHQTIIIITAVNWKVTRDQWKVTTLKFLRGREKYTCIDWNLIKSNQTDQTKI